MEKTSANSSSPNAIPVPNEVIGFANDLPIDPESEERVRQRWQQIRCYGFECGGAKLIAPLNVYCELLTNITIEALPNAPEYFLGLCNVRGNLVPVYQLEPLLNQTNLSKRYALIIGKLDQAAALIVAAKPKPFDLREFEQVETADDIPKLLQGAITASYRQLSNNWHQIDHHQLFNTLVTMQQSTITNVTI